METGPDLSNQRYDAITRHDPELYEFLLLLLAIAVLAWLSGNLTVSGDLGRADRYAGSHPDAVHMQWLLNYVGAQIAILGFSGWVVLIFGRRFQPELSSLWRFFLSLWDFIVPAGILWGAIWGLSRCIGDPAPTPWTITLWAILLAMLGILYNRIRTRPAQRYPIHFAVYPVFVFLSGLGWVWLLDFSSGAMTGPVQWMGLRRLDHMVIAFAVLSLISALAPLLNFVLRALSSERALGWGVRLLSIVPVFAVLAFFWWKKSSSGGKAAIQGTTSEVIRLTACLMLAWVIFRWGQWEEKGRWVMAMAGIFLLLGAGFAGTDDPGQLLVALVAAALLVSGLIIAAIRYGMGGKKSVAIIFGTLSGIGMVVGIFFLLCRMAPVFADIPQLAHVGKRIMAIQTTFSGSYQYLSELRWFMADAPFSGYGLGHTPYCGTLSDVVSQCRGLPKETPSDYVFAAVSGIFGPVVAWCIAALTADWFLLLCRRKPLSDDHPEYNANQFIHWLALVFSASVLAQVFITCLGSVGVVPLTGITFPLMSHGGSSLCFTALVAGLVLNQPKSENRRCWDEDRSE